MTVQFEYLFVLKYILDVFNGRNECKFGDFGSVIITFDFVFL